MNSKEFTADMPGKLVKTLEGHPAFVPSPLPGKVNWTDRLVACVSEAESALGRLAGLGARFERPQRLMRLFLRREAELSSRIENTHARVRTQLLFKFVPDVERQAPDVLEVDNNFKALEFGLEQIRRRPLSTSLVKQLHEILLGDVRSQDKTPGQFRTVQAHIGRTNDIRKARFVPAPPHFINDCMEELERFVQENSTVPRIARLAMVHYQFEAIHPFADGNGRIGRSLILLLIIQMGLLPLPLFNPSAYLEANRAKYYDHLLEVSRRGAWVDWIEFFSRGIIEECSDVSRRIAALERLRRRYQEKLQVSRGSVKISKFADELFHGPLVQLGDVMRLLHIGAPTAQRYIDRFLGLKILKEVTGNRRHRVYLAHEIVQLIQARLTDRH